MQYKPETEKLAMAGTAYVPVQQPLPLAADPEIRRTRKAFIIILGVLLALCVISAISTIAEFGNENSRASGTPGSKLASSLTAILIYGIGIFVAHQYSPLGLRIFAWLGVIELIGLGIAIVFLLFGAIAALTAAALTEKETKMIMIVASIGVVVFIIACVIAFILTIIIVKLAFKLARLIDANKRLTIQQM